MHLVIVTGRSGSGKSSALNVLEDAGYVCIDNLPVSFLLDLIERELEGSHNARNFAIAIDVRNPSRDLETIGLRLKSVETMGVRVDVIFLDADTPTLIRRFSETRRKHPLTGKSTDLQNALQQESQLLEALKELSSLTVDSSRLSPDDLHQLIGKSLSLETHREPLLLFQSFGFKNGVPPDADFVFDVRCLPNPHWDESLRKLTGKDKAVADYLEKIDLVTEMVESIGGFLQKWLPAFETGSRNYVTIALGCTGGRHRSVYMAETLQKRFVDDFANVQVRHRDLSP